MLKILKRLKLSEWLQVSICALLIVVQVWLDLKLPDYTKEITMLIKQSGAMREIWINGAYMMACALGSLVSAIGVCYFASRISASLGYRLRSQIYNKVEAFSMEEIGNFSTSSLITRSTNDVTQVQNVVSMGIQVLIKAPIMAIWAVCKIAGKSWQWSVSTVVAVVLMLTMLSLIMIFALPRFRIIQKLTDNLNRITRENLTGVRVVRAYNAEQYQEDKFEKANADLTNTHMYTGKLMAILMPGISLVMNGLSLVIYWLGAYLINGASLVNKLGIFSDMIVYSSYAMQIVMSFMMLVMMFIMLPRAQVSAKRINEVLDTPIKIVDGGLQNMPTQKGEIEFKNVSFSYPGASENVLNNVSFTVSKGQTVAFIGSTGSGKSTLINLIPRFYDASSGEVLVDGVNVKDYKQFDLHNKIGYISQSAVIFSGDINSNINFGDDGKDSLTDKDIESAVEVAQAKEFVDKLPDKYNSHIAQSGTNLSGGQKQRLAIARAIARKPEIFIFDDSFSALDYKTDKKLRKALETKTKESTKLIVAQRIGTIIDSDKIIVLDNGNVVGIGTHSELLKKCKVYKEIALSQLSKEELENA